MKLTEILRRSEGKTLEFKRDLSSPAGFLRTVVAFANTAGGVILIGVQDRTRDIRGVADPLDLEERVVNLISDSIKPRLLPDVELLNYRNLQVVAVEVFPSPARPHYLARAGLQRGTYARVGSSNRLADAALVAEMRRYATGESFDEGPLPALDSEAVDFRAASESFAPARTLARHNLPGPVWSSWCLADSCARWAPGCTIPSGVTSPAARSWATADRRATRVRCGRRRRCRRRPGPARRAARRPCRSAACGAPPARAPGWRCR